MGAVGGLLGLGGGAGGTSFGGPQAASLTAPTNAAQLGTAYSGNQAALGSQQALLAALQGQNGLGNQSSVYNQLQGVTNGTGPNPAAAQLAQATGQNVANQAALAAGQRGANANVGLQSRNAAIAGGNAQQQAIGQGATLQANQSLNALNSQAGIANTQAANQIAGTNANTQAQQSEQQNLLNANQGYNTNQVAMQSNINSANAGLANTQLQGQQGVVGGVMSAGGALTGLAEGGDVPSLMANGGDSTQPQSSFGQFIKNGPSNKTQPMQQTSQMPQMQSGPAALQTGMTNLATGLGKLIKGKPAPTDAMAKGGDYRSGGKVQAKGKDEKATSKGDSYSNDKIPAMLSEHEIVIPRSITLGKDPVRGAAEFVAATIAKRKVRG